MLDGVQDRAVGPVHAAGLRRCADTLAGGVLDSQQVVVEESKLDDRHEERDEEWEHQGEFD
jgi:hypothetical protein